jgi:hypothetical protein
MHFRNLIYKAIQFFAKDRYLKFLWFRDNFNGNDVAYQWYFEGNLLPQTTANLPISQIGTYEVRVDNATCITSREIEVSVNENPFELLLESGCVNYDYMLWVANIAEISGATVTWTGPDNFTFYRPLKLI